MDELEFRRAIYADPNTKTSEVKQAASDDPSRQAFWNDLKSLEKSIDAASQVDVPENLADRLIWQQNMHRFAEQKRRSRFHLAAAASIAFTIGVSLTLFYQPHAINLTEQALAHSYYAEQYEYNRESKLSAEQLNNKLSRFVNARFEGELGRIYSANYCELDDIKTLHLVMEHAGEPISLFIIPHQESLNTKHAFSDKRFQGKTIELDNASLIIIGEKDQPLDTFEAKVKEKLVFSA